MLQQDQASDFVVATGVSHSVKDLVEIAFEHVGLDWQSYVKTDPSLLRPAEVDRLVGDASRAREILDWKPSLDLATLIRIMVDADLERVKGEPVPSAHARVP